MNENEMQIIYRNDQHAIIAAYDAQVQALFKVLVGSLSHDIQGPAMARFSAGLAIARQARKLALDEIDKVEKEVTLT